MNTSGVSPKTIAAIVTAVLSYLLAQTVLDLPSWAVLASQAVLVGIAAYTVSPGNVTVDAPPSDDVLLQDHDVRNRLA